MKVIQSPNFDERNKNSKINILMMHYTGMKTAQEALDRMCDAKSQVSAHYMIYEDGQVVNLVPEEKRAWHAGISCWQGISSLNHTSIGIEIVNPGHEWGYVPFPAKQMDAVLELSKAIIARHDIEARNVVGHSDVAPSRKEDPGELFDWRYLAKNGVGLWHGIDRVRWGDKILNNPGEESSEVAHIQTMLARYGYHIRVDGYYGEKTEKIIKAFKRHFSQESINASWDKAAEVRLKALVELV